MHRVWERRAVAVRVCFVIMAWSSANDQVARAAGRSPEWWPAGAHPPFLELAADQAEHPRAIRLQSATFRTDISAGGGSVDPGSLLPAELRGEPIMRGGWGLIQFDPALDARARRELLESFGVLPGGYVPNHAVLGRIPAGVADSLSRTPGVRWVGRLHPGFKLSPQLGAPLPGEPAATSSEPAAWTLALWPAPEADLAQLQRELEQLGVAVLDGSAAMLRVTVPDGDALLALARLDSILYVEEAPEPQLFNDQSRGICQSGTPGVDSLRIKGLLGANQTVAVMDSGIDTRHCCFDGAGKIVDNRAWGGTLGALCTGDHGTHVSGTVACDNGGDHDGLAPQAKLILQDIQKGDTFACLFGSVSPPNPLSNAWADARTRGARIHTNSWGSSGNSYGSAAREIDEFMWNNQDFLIVYAAGNSGSAAGTLGPYSNAKNSVTVGGVQNGAGYENMYGSSSRGPAGDGRLLPDLTAPAQGVSSSLNNRSAASCGWTTYSGTSMATPAVAGSAALVRDYLGRGFYPTGNAVPGNSLSPSAALVKALLLVSTRDMTGSGIGGSRPNGDQGFGRLTLDDSLWFAGDDPAGRLEILDDRNIATGFTLAGQEQTFTFGLKGAAALKLMLTWTDAPGTPGGAKALVNDLDLVVTTADGRSFAGNLGFAGGWTTTAAEGSDALNNKEAVMLRSAPPGPVTVTVRAATLGDVAAHPQDYALVAVGALDPTCIAGNSPTIGAVSQSHVGNDLRASWIGSDATSYTVYRGTTPDFMSDAPSPYRSGVQDEDPGSAGIQWSDLGAAGSAVSYYYLYFAANGCGELIP